MPPEHGSPADWLRYAQSDLDAAKGPPRGRLLLETLCFHAQQAVEKSLKALLIAKGMEFPRTHNLGVLLDLLSSTVSLPADRIAVAGLTEYAVATRYPGEEEPVSEEQYHEAVRLAEAVVSWAEGILRRSGAL